MSPSLPGDPVSASTETKTLRLSYVLGTMAVIAIILSLAAAAFWFEKQRHLERASIATANMAELLEESVGNTIQKIDVALQAGRLFYESRAVAESRIAAQLNAYLGGLGTASATLGTIRGLTGQTGSRVDGRAYFTAGGREFNVEGASPGMVAGIDVYKNPSADHIEGAIGGLVNIRTRRPFDFRGLAVSAAAGGRFASGMAAVQKLPGV